MRLSELNPKLTEGVLRFDCPCGAGHAIRIPVGPVATVSNENPKGDWGQSGTFPESYSLIPSVQNGCWHGEIKNGEVVTI